MPELIYFDSTKEPGTVESLPDGRSVRFVEPEEYYPAMLSRVMNATLVFLHANAPGVVPPDRQVSVDDAIADLYWNTYLGCLTPPPVIDAIARVMEGLSGDILLADIEEARLAIFDAGSVEEAVDVHAQHRIQMVLRGAEGLLTDTQTSTGELLIDYMLLQRGIAEDIRRSEEERAEGETRGAVLVGLDRKADLQFERLLTQVLHPRQVYQMVPQNRRRDLEVFAQRRRPLHTTGVLE